MQYRCTACGHESPKWMGFCPSCRNDAALVEVRRSGGRSTTPAAPVVPVTAVAGDAVTHRPTGLGEVDRVLGGGLVDGAAVLVGGEPGVGKSTLLLEVAGALARSGSRVVVASAEESAGQVAMRARRLGIDDDAVLLVADGDVDAIVAAAEEAKPDLLVVDSIQTVGVAELGGAPGGVAQVRESAARFVHLAKQTGMPVVLVGHVTKDGSLAGPKTLEHAVDVVLELEGDPDRGLRVLRCLKNRFGATHQVGLFEMGDEGMNEVPDPSGLLLGRWRGGVPGSVAFPAIDGRRALLVEVQALVSTSSTPQPRRSVRGLETARVHQVLAVLERHAGLRVSGMDVYASVVGGLRIRDPGADLPVAVAVASSLLGLAVPPTAVWGEVGLTGEVRGVAHGDRRRAEVDRLGLEALTPSGEGTDRIEPMLARLGLVGRSRGDSSREP
ncbi:MAG: DNA repair protein RadA [Acidimicrobiia bacterium]|nr:DNA repair protein RadA [Acidimicrobiia bacterium]